MEYEISSPLMYDEVMGVVFKLMNKDSLSPEEIKGLFVMVAAAEKYEDEVLGLKPHAIP